MKQRQRGTYCPKLWNGFYINYDGNVYGCCHEKPEILGNIYQSKLQEICNNEIIRDLRRKSLNGQLKCFKKCVLLHKKEPSDISSSLIVDYHDLKRLKILFGEACNINCVMCWQNSKNRECLDYERLVENVELSPFGSIEIQGGEPLFIPSAKKFFDYAASKNKKVSFLTNGLLINEQWAQKIALHSKFIYFSINAATKETHELINRGSRWEKLLTNIQKVNDARETFHTHVKILGHMTIIRQNWQEIPLFIRTFRTFGFDAINFCFDYKVPYYLKIYPGKGRLKRQIETALDECREDSSSIKLLELKLLGLV